MRPVSLARALAACALVVLGACDQTGQPLSPEAPTTPAVPLLEMTCVASVRGTPSVTCGAAEPAGGDARKLIAGKQGKYIRLTSSNITTVADTFAFDVTVQNLIPQALGTTDGVTLDPAGVRVFFARGPNVVAGSGQAEVANADGIDDYTQTGQPYFQYDEVLGTGQTSGSKPWKLRLDPGVQNITFGVLVSAAVRFPNGWVDVSPVTDTLSEGSGQLLTGTSLTALGDTVAEAITWSTSDPAVATVDGSGQLTAVSPGSVIVGATSGPRSGQASVSVCPDLEVGEAFTASMPLASSLCFGGASGAAAEYAYIPLNLSTSSSLSLSVTGSGIVPVSNQASPAFMPAPGLAALAPGEGETANRAHLATLARNTRETAGLLARGGGRLRPSAARTGGARRAITPGVPAVGDLYNLNVAAGCSGTPDLRTGRIRTVSTHAIIVSDTSNPAGGFTTAQYDSIALEFDTLAYPVVASNFGAPADIDGNGRVVVFFTRAYNEKSPPATAASIFSEFLARDLFPADPVSGCERSNVGEIIYAMVPDPTGAVNSNVREVSRVRGNTSRTLAHDLQHLANASRRMHVHGSTTLEEPWLDEGLSRITQELMFYRTAPGLAPRGNINLTSLTQGPTASRRVAAFNTYANPQFTDIRTWLQRPDTTGALRNEASNLSVQGALWGFLRYSADRTGGTESAFWYSLVNGGLTGRANLQAAIGGSSPDLWLRDYTMAMFVDDLGFPVAPEYSNPSWNYRTLFAQLGGLPYTRRNISDGTPLTLSYRYGGGSSLVRFAVPADSYAGVTALSGGVVPTSPFQLVVMRTK